MCCRRPDFDDPRMPSTSATCIAIRGSSLLPRGNLLLLALVFLNTNGIAGIVEILHLLPLPLLQQFFTRVLIAHGDDGMAADSLCVEVRSFNGSIGGRRRGVGSSIWVVEDDTDMGELVNTGSSW